MIMTINEQIKEILEIHRKSVDWKKEAPTFNDYRANKIISLFQPKTTSTDIESLKKDYEEYFCNGTTIEELEMEEDGDDLTAVYVWRWFESRLSNKSEVKKEAVCRVCGMETSTVYNINLKATHICNKCGRSIAKQELDSMFYLSSDEKNSEGEGK